MAIEPEPTTSPDQQARRFAERALSGDDPTGWFEPFYAAAARGELTLPWDRGRAQPLLVSWAERHEIEGTGRSALVVGSGPGYDSEYLASLGFAVTAFDIAESAVRGARSRFPESTVDYHVADLLDAPPSWWHAFDMVLESFTVQALPPSLHARTIAAISGSVAPGGTLLFVGARDEQQVIEPPPWPLDRTEIDSFADHELAPVLIEEIPNEAGGPVGLWRAEFRRSPSQR